MEKQILKTREALELLDILYNGKNTPYLKKLSEIGLIRATAHYFPRYIREDLLKVKQWIMDGKIALTGGKLVILDDSILNEVAA